MFKIIAWTPPGCTTGINQTCSAIRKNLTMLQISEFKAARLNKLKHVHMSFSPSHPPPPFQKKRVCGVISTQRSCQSNVVFLTFWKKSSPPFTLPSAAAAGEEWDILERTRHRASLMSVYGVKSPRNLDTFSLFFITEVEMKQKKKRSSLWIWAAWSSGTISYSERVASYQVWGLVLDLLGGHDWTRNWKLTRAERLCQMLLIFQNPDVIYE